MLPLQINMTDLILQRSWKKSWQVIHVLWGWIMLEDLSQHDSEAYSEFKRTYQYLTNSKCRNMSHSNRTQETIKQNLKETKTIRYRNRCFQRLDELRKIYAEESVTTSREFVEHYVVLDKRSSKSKTKKLSSETWQERTCYMYIHFLLR